MGTYVQAGDLGAGTIDRQSISPVRLDGLDEQVRSFNTIISNYL
jgi:hypothetical protein